MTWNSRLDVVEALENAGWTGDEGHELSILRHPSGALFAMFGDSGECGIETPGSRNAGTFTDDAPDAMVIAAALAASGQLAPQVRGCDAERHAVPHSAACPQAHPACATQ